MSICGEAEPMGGWMGTQVEEASLVTQGQGKRTGFSCGTDAGCLQKDLSGPWTEQRTCFMGSFYPLSALILLRSLRKNLDDDLT